MCNSQQRKCASAPNTRSSIDLNGFIVEKKNGFNWIIVWFKWWGNFVDYIVNKANHGESGIIPIHLRKWTNHSHCRKWGELTFVRHLFINFFSTLVSKMHENAFSKCKTIVFWWCNESILLVVLFYFSLVLLLLLHFLTGNIKHWVIFIGKKKLKQWHKNNIILSTSFIVRCIWFS